MVPDAVLVSLHHHAHTEHTNTNAEKQAKVEKEHKHCPVDELFETPFQGSCQATIATPIAQQASYSGAVIISWPSLHTVLKKQRGPPVA